MQGTYVQPEPPEFYTCQRCDCGDRSVVFNGVDTALHITPMRCIAVLKEWMVACDKKMIELLDANEKLEDEIAKEAPEPDWDSLVRYMVDRFLCWRLPDDFAPDCGIDFKADYYNKQPPHSARHQPSGTNLFTATQADQMVRNMLKGYTTPLTPKREVIGHALIKEGRACVWGTAEATVEGTRRLAELRKSYNGGTVFELLKGDEVTHE